MTVTRKYKITATDGTFVLVGAWNCTEALSVAAFIDTKFCEPDVDIKQVGNTEEFIFGVEDMIVKENDKFIVYYDGKQYSVKHKESGYIIVFEGVDNGQMDEDDLR